MAEIKKYLDTTALGTLVDQIKAEDAKVKAAAEAYAKEYADGLAKNYDAAGAAATAESNAKAHAEEKVNELANGQVKTNTEAIATLNGNDTTAGSVAKAVKDAKDALQANIDGVDAKANKNAEDIAAINNETTGILALAKADTKSKTDALQAEVDALETLVGVLPEGTSATSVVDYVDKKTAGIATESAMTELGNRVGVVEGKVATIEGDYLKAADKTELQGNIDKKADQTALDAVSAVANAAATQTALTEEANRAKGEEARIEDLVTAEADRAKGVEADFESRISTMEVFWDTTEDADGVVNKLKEIQEYIASDESGAATMAGNIQKNTQDIAAMDTAYKAADAELQGNIDELAGAIEDAKTDASNKDAVVLAEAQKATAAVQTALDQAVATLEGADNTLSGRIDALEEKFTGEGSVDDLISDAKEEVAASAAADATAKANAAESAAKGYTDAEIDKVEGTISALQDVVDGKASSADLTALTGRVTTAEGEIDTLQSEMDAVEAKASANETAIGTINTELAKKAAQSDLEAAVARIAKNETDISGLNDTVADKAEQSDLEAAIARIAKNETDIAANLSAINSFVAITPEEVNGLFA